MHGDLVFNSRYTRESRALVETVGLWITMGFDGFLVLCENGDLVEVKYLFWKNDNIVDERSAIESISKLFTLVKTVNFG